MVDNCVASAIFRKNFKIIITEIKARANIPHKAELCNGDILDTKYQVKPLNVVRKNRT
jgi:hypothetical protein